MEKNTFYIKNMVCNRCIESVLNIFESRGLTVLQIELGKVVTNREVTEEELSELGNQLRSTGFELLQDKSHRIISEIKAEIIKLIHYDKEIEGHVNISEYLSGTLGYDYSYLSNLFSSVEGTTIEKYVINQRIERVKELLVYDEMTLKEIAYQMGYSSVQHLSNQFKKINGLSPSHFRKIKEKKRKPIDQV